jgi:hypothetical protein
MILGISSSAFTVLHVVLSLVGIGAGMVVLRGLVANRLYTRLNLIFLVTTALTDLTGFAFPNSHITPAIVLGILSSIALAIASAAIYWFHLAGKWRSTFVVSAMIGLYFNVFVLVVQMFRHVPFLTQVDPNQSGPPFGIAQLAVLALFVWLTVVAVRGFRGERNAH